MDMIRQACKDVIKRHMVRISLKQHMTLYVHYSIAPFSGVCESEGLVNQCQYVIFPKKNNNLIHLNALTEMH